MISKETRRRILHLVNKEKIPIRQAARMLGLSRTTVKKYLREPEKEPALRLSESGTFLSANGKAVKTLFEACGRSCPKLQKRLEEEFGTKVELRTLQRFCSPLRRKPSPRLKSSQKPKKPSAPLRGPEARARVLRLVNEEMVSIREAARMTGLSRTTVRKYLREPEKEPAPRLSESGAFLSANREAVEALFEACGQSCPQLRKRLEEEFGTMVGLRTLQRFCSSLRRKPSPRPKRPSQKPPKPSTPLRGLEARARVLRLVNEEKVSIREAARMIGLSRTTVKKYLREPEREPTPRPLSESGMFLRANREDVEVLFEVCGRSCPQLQKRIEEVFARTVPLRMLQHFCHPLCAKCLPRGKSRGSRPSSGGPAS